MRIIVAIAVLGLCLIGSCTSCNGPGNNNEPGSTNANGNSNGNRGASSGAAAPDATPPPELTASSAPDPNFKECNPYYPLIPGSQAKYSIAYSTGLQATATVVAEQSTENGVPVFVQKTQIVDKTGGANKYEMLVQKFVCEKGRIKFIAETSDNSVEGHKTVMDMHYVDPAYIMLEPAALRPGATWSYSFTQTFNSPETGITNSDRASTFSCEVQGEQEITVPAGKFKALPVKKRIGKVDITEYFARGMGLIKRANADGTTWELLSFGGLRPTS